MFEQDDWSSATSTRNETKSTGAFIRLKDGEKALLVFPVAPFDYRQVWNPKENKSEIYDSAKHDGMRPTGRFAFPVFEPVPNAREYTAKIFDASGETFDKIKACREKYGPKYLYEITRKGSGKDTQYSVLPERELKDEEIKYLRSLQPLDAEAMTIGSGSASSEPSDTPTGNDPWA